MHWITNSNSMLNLVFYYFLCYAKNSICIGDMVWVQPSQKLFYPFKIERVNKTKKQKKSHYSMFFNSWEAIIQTLSSYLILSRWNNK